VERIQFTVLTVEQAGYSGLCAAHHPQWSDYLSPRVWDGRSGAPVGHRPSHGFSFGFLVQAVHRLLRSNLLAQESKLSLDDDIHKYLPKPNDFGKSITIGHLLHHASSLRDQWNLLALAARRLDDVITEDDILNLVWRQRSLNFMPGDEAHQAQGLIANLSSTGMTTTAKGVPASSLTAGK
jgi:hypothetical protein